MLRIILLILCLSVYLEGFNQTNIVINGNFESGLSEWSNWFDNSNGYFANFQLSSTEVFEGQYSAEVNITGIGMDSTFSRIMLRNTSFSLEQGIEYSVSFWLKSNSQQEFLVQVHRDSAPYTTYASLYLMAGTDWQEYTFDFESPVTTSDVRFTLKLGNTIADYFFDDVKITPNFNQVYSNLLDSSYAIDWSIAGVPGGIPNIPNVINVLDYGAIGDGLTDNRIAFENAFAASNFGEAVYVPGGDYLINGKITIPEGRVLRGECPSNTKLLINVGATTSCIDVLTFEYGTFRALLSGYEKGSNLIFAQNTNDINVGDYVEIQQLNDSSLMYTIPFWEVSWAEESVGQLFKVTAIDALQISLDRPIYYGFNSELNPEIRPIGLIEDVGIENLYVERLDSNDGHTIDFSNAARCWIRNIESNMTFRSHVNMSRAIDCEIRDSYFHHSHDYGGGGHGYGTNLGRHVTACLIENNIFETLRHAMLIQVGATGNVFGYNYSLDPYWSNSTTNIPPDISMHGHFPSMNLFEGNIVQEATYSDYWGPVGPGNTMFRNRVEQSDILILDHSHNQNVIANELTGGTNTITIDASVLDTRSHSNDRNGFVKDSTQAPVPASLYLTKFPKFLTGYPFPALGYEVAAVNSIPAKDRFDNGNPILACYCDTNQSCFDACPLNIDDIYLGGGFPFQVLEFDYHAVNSISSSGNLQNGASIKFIAGSIVSLLSGFSTENASNFEATIQECE